MAFHIMEPHKQPQVQKNKLKKLEIRVNLCSVILSFLERIIGKSGFSFLKTFQKSLYHIRKVEITHTEEDKLRSKTSKQVTGKQNLIKCFLNRFSDKLTINSDIS